MSGAKDLLAGAHTAAERMEIFDPVVEELFHVEQDYLEKLFKRFFSPKTSRQEGSLAFFKCQLRRTNVNGQVKGGFQVGIMCCLLTSTFDSFKIFLLNQ